MVIIKYNRKMKKIVLQLIICGLLTSMFSSCNLAGLDLQKDFEYEYSPVELKLDMTAYQFIESRKNMDMSILYDAINLAGYKEAFETADRTYIILNDIAFTAYLKDKRYAGVQSMSTAELKKLLDGNIVKGHYLSLDLTTTPVKVETLNPGSTMYLSLRSQKNDIQNKYEVRINEVVNSANIVSVVTSNLQPTNGVMHVVDAYPEYRLK